MSTGRMSDYSVYTTEFDEVHHIGDLLHMEGELAASHREMNRFRVGSDHPFEGLDSWSRPLRDELSGFVELNDLDRSDTMVTFLVDLSNSTRGHPSRHMTLAVMEHCLALQALDIRTAVLGYTTTSWKGGESAKKWIDDGQPGNPGRLCDLRHIVFKTPDEDARTTVRAVSGLAVNELKRENVDGEALLWAEDFMADWEIENGILVNITDGFFPIDDATLLNNSHDILTTHALDVCDGIEEREEIALSRVYIDQTAEDHASAMRTRGIEGRLFTRESFSAEKVDAIAAMNAVTDGVRLGFERAGHIAQARMENARSL